MKETFFSRWRADFFTGLAVVLPGLISIAVLGWMFGTVSNFTNKLLFFLPRWLTHADEGRGEVHWYWSVIALLIALKLITLIGRAARHYIGRKLIEWAEFGLLKVPVLNKVYGLVKQVNEALSSKKSSFKQVVLVPFPHQNIYSLGFLTNEQPMTLKDELKLITVFVPTTPNPTSGFLVLIPEKDVQRLDISVAEGIRYIISIGSIPPTQGVQPGAFQHPPVQM